MNTQDTEERCIMSLLYGLLIGTWPNAESTPATLRAWPKLQRSVKARSEYTQLFRKCRIQADMLLSIQN